MRGYWVFNIGTGTEAPPEDWIGVWRHHSQEMWFPRNRRPSGVRPGDRAVINGSLRRGFIAVVEVVSEEPEINEGGSPAARERWPWKLKYRILVAIRADLHAPSLEDVAWENPLRLRRQSHVRIDRDVYERVSTAIVDAARRAVAP